MKRVVPITTAFRTLLGLSGPTFGAWRALIGGAFGCQLTAEEAETFATLTGGRSPLAARCRELWIAVGRRGGKNFVAARIAIYLALLHRWKLAPGEVGIVLVLASTRDQANVAFRYIKGALEAHDALAAEVEEFRSATIVLRNGIEIRIGTADNASVRGATLVAVLCDEYAFWQPEDAVEVVRAVRPGMATQPDAMLIVISSVYSATSPFGEAFRRNFGKDDPYAVYARATTRQMNPTIPQEFIDAEIARDPVANTAEYLSVERSDVASFLDAALVDGCTRPEPRELPFRLTLPNGTPISYFAGIDVSGGRGDATAVAVAHAEGDRVVIDACRRFPAPHDPAAIAASVASFLQPYGITRAIGDHYGAELSRSIYAEVGVALAPAEATRSECYLRLLPLLTTGRIELPPEPTLRTELLGLERRTARSGKDSVDHRPGAHDDLANAVALAAVAAARPFSTNYDVDLIEANAWTGFLDRPAEGGLFDLP
jgi:hypothetical protein